MEFKSYDPRFEELLREDSKLEKLCTGTIWAEGPVYFAEGDYLLWSDIPNNRMMRYSKADGQTVFREPANFTNGHYRDLQGNLLSCEHGGRRVTRTLSNGTIEVMVDNYQGKRLNSPNDIVVKSDGSIWFTDPPYGILSNREGYKADSELEGNFVFCYYPDRQELTIVADDRDKPNGLAFSPDESILYVSDTGGSHKDDGWHHIFAYDVSGSSDASNPYKLSNSRIFAEVSPGLSDGFRLDVHGNIFTSSGDSIQVYAPDGSHLGKIMVPEIIANCTFGGANKDYLYIVASSSLYGIRLNTQGIQKP